MADGLQVEGVDYAWSRPDIAQLAAAGKRFACRYGGAGSSGKQLDPAEAQALGAAGIAVVANVEGAADGLLGGWSAGVSWARGAEAHFASCGMPRGRPIYLSVDFDVQSGQWAAVAAALRGAASVLGGVHRVGVYGGRRAIEWARRDGVAQWFWQTYAWSSGVWVPGNHIEQYRNGVALAGATLDLDRALKSDFGQWTIGDGMDTAVTWNTGWMAQRVLLEDADTIVIPANSALGASGYQGPNHLKRHLTAIEAKLAALTLPPPAEIDYVTLAAALRPIVAAECEAAVRKVLGAVDETQA